MTNVILQGKPDEGNSHIRFDEGEVASAKPKRGLSLCIKKIVIRSVCTCALATLLAGELVAGAESEGVVKTDETGLHLAYEQESTGKWSLNGGKESFPSIWFGGAETMSGDNNDSAAWVRVFGGVLSVGGVRTNPKWNHNASSTMSWGRLEVNDGELDFVENAEVSQPLSVLGEGRVSVSGGKSVALAEGVSGSGALVKNGEGVLVANGGCSYLGNTVVNAGTFVITKGSGEMPVATSIFDADAISGGDGDGVNSWSTLESPSYVFNYSTIQSMELYARPRWAVPPSQPTLSKNAFNGHSAVAFGGSQALAIGQNKQMTMGATLTVAVVLKVEAGAGSAETDWREAAGIVGSGIVQSGADYRGEGWGLSVDARGCVSAGISSQVFDGQVKSVKDADHPIADGESHILIYSYVAGERLTLNVDGYRRSLDIPETSGLGTNRTIMAASDNGVYLRGKIAKVAVYRDMELTVAEEDEIGRDLAGKYGVVYCPEDVEDLAPHSSGLISVVAATGVWSADELVGDEGEGVSEWMDTTNGGVFNLSVAKSTHADATAPKLKRNTMNGHSAISFDGSFSALGMSVDDSKKYISTDSADGTNFTVVLVMRARQGSGDDKKAWCHSAGIIAQTKDAYGTWNGTVGWGMSVAENGRVLGGVHNNSATDANYMTMRSKPRFINDGESHVVIFVKGVEGQTLNVDGWVIDETLSGDYRKPRYANPTLLGRIASAQTSAPFAGEIAEVRIYRNKALSPEEQRSIGFELAAKYGAVTHGYVNPVAGTVASRRVEVAPGATIAFASAPLVVSQGRTVAGGGILRGRLEVGADGRIAPLQENATLTVDTLKMSGRKAVLDLSAFAGAAPQKIVFLSYGKLDSSEDVEWKIEGAEGEYKVVHESDKRQFVAKRLRGLMILFK